MGAWGTGHFDNDDALDWAAELQDSEDFEALTDALSVVNTTDYIEAPDASMALAAASVVAALKDQDMAGLPENIASWVTSSSLAPSEGLIAAAQTAVASVAISSELSELWEESESLEEWRSAMIALQQRLQ